MFSILEDLANKFNGQIPNLIYFGVGILLGIILFFITFLIVYLVSKSKPKNEDSINEVVIIPEYKVIIDSNKDIFERIYKEAAIGEKFKGIVDLTTSMMQEIAGLYYPDSDDPMFEVSIERLVDFLSYFRYRMELIIDDLFVDKLSFVEAIGKFKIKDAKLSKIMEILNKNKVEKVEEEKKGFVSIIKDKILKGAKKVGLGIASDVINYSFINVIDDLGEDINKLYSNQKLIFTELSKKELKKKKRQERKQKRKLGDSNA